MNGKRIGNVIKNMEKEGIEQIIISNPYSIYYLTGKFIVPGERLAALYLNINGEIILFSNKMLDLNLGGDIKSIVYSDGDNPILCMKEYIKKGNLGIDKFLKSQFLLGIMKEIPGAVPVDGSFPVDCARMIKDSEEIEKMIYASQINDKVMEGAISYIREGLTERGLSNRIKELYIENGVKIKAEPVVCFGKNGASPHHVADNTMIREGDSIEMDIFQPINGYWCDMTRTVFFKNVSDEDRRIYEIVKEANIKAISIAKPGVAFADIDSVARNVIKENGYGEYFIHRLGHNIGLECHEIPDVSKSENLIVKENSVFSIEPGIYIPNRIGIRIEDLILITKDCARTLNKVSKELLIVG